MLVWESLPWISNPVFFLPYGEVLHLSLLKSNKYAWCICYWSRIILCVLYAYMSNKCSLPSKKSHFKFHFKHYMLSHLTSLDSKQHNCMLSIYISNPPLGSNFKTNLSWSQLYFNILKQICQQRILTCFHGFQIWNSVLFITP